MSVIRVEKLSKVYGGSDNPVNALRDVDLTINTGEFVAVMGPSGSGKSTLLHLIGGLDQPTAGSIWLGDTEIGALPDGSLSRLRREKIGFIFQFFNLLPTLTARENVALPLLLNRIPRKDALERADAALQRLGLTDRADHRPAQLSGGQQQRVGIARALVIHPVLMLGDEPTGALDTHTGAEVVELLRELSAHAEHTVVLVTHNPRVAAYADRIVYLKDGRVVDDERLDGRHPSASEIHKHLNGILADAEGGPS
ncbi:MAG: ABC transporter ATP-binding protein [Anaerolineales bacterium]